MFRFPLISTGKAVKILSSDTASQSSQIQPKPRKSKRGSGGLVGAQAVQGCPSMGNGCWWPLGAIQTAMGPEVTGQDTSFQLLRKE